MLLVGCSRSAPGDNSSASPPPPPPPPPPRGGKEHAPWLRNPHRLIVHLGPMKTGSTALQARLFGALRPRLAAMDNVLVPRFVGARNHNCLVRVVWRNGSHSAGRFDPEGLARLAGFMRRYLHQPKATFVTTHENGAFVADLAPYARLASELHVRLHFVTVYRRFYSWLVSLHFQLQAKYPQRLRSLCAFEPISEWLSVERVRQYHESESAGAVYRRLQGAGLSVSVLNLHALREPTMTTQMVCSHLYAPHTCEWMRSHHIRDYSSNSADVPRLRALEIARGACSQGLLEPEARRPPELIDKVLQAINATACALGYHTAAVPQRWHCPSLFVVRQLLELSASDERLLFPGWHNPNEMRASFNAMRHAHSFCSLNTDALWDDPRWRRLWAMPELSREWTHSKRGVASTPGHHPPVRGRALALVRSPIASLPRCAEDPDAAVLPSRYELRLRKWVAKRASSKHGA
jgi:hypothetical protein